MFKSETAATMATVFAMVLAIAGIMLFKRRSKLKGSPSHNN